MSICMLHNCPGDILRKGRCSNLVCEHPDNMKGNVDMDTAQVKGHLARIGEILRKPDENAHDTREAGKLALNLLEDFLLDHKRQTELLTIIAEMIERAEHRALVRGE